MGAGKQAQRRGKTNEKTMNGGISGKSEVGSRKSEGIREDASHPAPRIPHLATQLLTSRDQVAVLAVSLMEVRESLLNLAITCALVLVVALVAVFLRSHRGTPVAIPVAVATPVTGGGSTANSPALAHPIEDRFQAFPKAALIASTSNEADTLRIRVGNEEQVFVLYFVDALDASLAHTQRVDAQAQYFGKTTRETVVAGGQAALNYVQTLLRDRPFKVLTRWERVPNLDRYYALIVVDYEPGKPAYLADLLVKNGYAWAGSLTTPLPDDKRTPNSYALELNKHAQYAREHKLGIWSMVK